MEKQLFIVQLKIHFNIIGTLTTNKKKSKRLNEHKL